MRCVADQTYWLHMRLHWSWTEQHRHAPCARTRHADGVCCRSTAACGGGDESRVRDSRGYPSVWFRGESQGKAAGAEKSDELDGWRRMRTSECSSPRGGKARACGKRGGRGWDGDGSSGGAARGYGMRSVET